MQKDLPKPIANADSQAYWAAAKERRLVLRKCQSCGEVHFMPRYVCPHCWSDQLVWIESRGTGKVHSFSIIRRASDPAFAARVPYVIALIDLDEGVRMMANILGENALSVEIDSPVSVTFEDRGHGDLIPQFELLSR